MHEGWLQFPGHFTTGSKLPGAFSSSEEPPRDVMAQTPPWGSNGGTQPSVASVALCSLPNRLSPSAGSLQLNCELPEARTLFPCCLLVAPSKKESLAPSRGSRIRSQVPSASFLRIKLRKSPSKLRTLLILLIYPN